MSLATSNFFLFSLFFIACQQADSSLDSSPKNKQENNLSFFLSQKDTTKPFIFMVFNPEDCFSCMMRGKEALHYIVSDSIKFPVSNVLLMIPYIRQIEQKKFLEHTLSIHRKYAVIADDSMVATFRKKIWSDEKAEEKYFTSFIVAYDKHDNLLFSQNFLNEEFWQALKSLDLLYPAH